MAHSLNLPFFAYLLLDRKSLSADDQKGKSLTTADINRHLYTLKRERDKLKPDYCIEADFEREKAEIDYNENESLRFYLVKTIKYLSKRYLCFRCGQLYVKDEMFDEWMEFVRIFPPLMVEVAFFVDNCPFRNDEYEFFTKFLVPIFGNSAIRRPFNRNLEQYVKDEGGLCDLHVHINGTAETDMIWWSQIGNVEQWARSLFPAWANDEVKRQHEQISDYPIKEAIKWLCNVKELLRDIITEMYLRSGTNMLFQSASEFFHYNGEGCPILSKGAYFYWKLFTLMQGECFSDETTCSVYKMMLILGYVHQMTVQQWSQKGFSQFQMITKNALRFTQERKKFDVRFKQLGLDNDLKLLKYIEVRFSPSIEYTDNITKISNIRSGFGALCNKIQDIDDTKPKLRLIAHFIKEKDTRNSGYCRHCELRSNLVRKARSLWKTNRYLLQKQIAPISGIDAAANEMDAGPEVFSPAFRLLRRLMREKEKTDLHFTYHAGEDFKHLLSGLRAMIEAVEFLEMEQGDRLGHCTAAGIKPSLWINRMGGRTALSKGEWLDDLLMVYYMVSKNSLYPDLTQLLPLLHNEIEDLHTEIYDGNYSIMDMIKAWKLRMYDPDIYLRKKHCYYAFLRECDDDIQGRRVYSKAEKLFYKYHYDDDVKNRYKEIIEIRLDTGIFNEEILIKIQNLVLNKIAQAEIAIEVLFTSNLSISFYLSPQEHHLDRWLTNSTEGNPLMPPVVVGSDDPGIFMTNIYIEYYRIMKYLECHGYGFRERMKILNGFTFASRYYRFS